MLPFVDMQAAALAGFLAQHRIDPLRVRPRPTVVRRVRFRAAARKVKTMMELVERAIPVIQHVPGTGAVQEPKTRDAARSPAASPHSTAPDCDSGHDEQRQHEDSVRAGLDEALSQVHRTLERLRTQHAQLTSGALLQQYQRQTSSPVADSRPATRVVSVQG